jgi:hypothetical protein
MDIMVKKILLVLAVCAMGVSPVILQAAKKSMDCSTMSDDVQQFADQLTTENKRMFCGKFTEGQRASAMQMASTQDESGMTMSPDDAVRKVSGASGSNPQGKTPAGCPVK